MGFLTDPRYAQTIAPDQVGQIARGNVPNINSSYDVGGQMVQAPMGLSNPGPLAPPHIADQAANIIGQYITDHGNLLRRRLQMAHAANGFAPPKYGIPDLPSQAFRDPGFNRNPGGLPAFLKNIPAFTRDPGWSNQGALQARFAGALKNLPQALMAHAAPQLRSEHAPSLPPRPYLGRH